MRALFLAAAVLCLAAIAPACATWKPECTQLPIEVQTWYENAWLMPAAQPRLGFAGCCKTSDVVKTQFRLDARNGQPALVLSERQRLGADPRRHHPLERVRAHNATLNAGGADSASDS